MKKVHRLYLMVLFSFLLSSCEEEELISGYFLDFISPTEYELRNTNYTTGDTKHLTFKYSAKYTISRLEFSFIRVNKDTGEQNIYDFQTFYVNTQKKSGTVIVPWNIPQDPTPENHAERIQIEVFRSEELLAKRVQTLKPILPKD